MKRIMGLFLLLVSCEKNQESTSIDGRHPAPAAHLAAPDTGETPVEPKPSFLDAKVWNKGNLEKLLVIGKSRKEIEREIGSPSYGSDVNKDEVFYIMSDKYSQKAGAKNVMTGFSLRYENGDLSRVSFEETDYLGSSPWVR